VVLLLSWFRGFEAPQLLYNVFVEDRSSLIEAPAEQQQPASALGRLSGLRAFFSGFRAYFIFDPLIFLYTFMLGSASLLASFFDPDGSKQHGIARVWSRWILASAMCPVRVIGMEGIDPSTTAIYAANHISALDIPVLFASLPFQFRILAKEELFRYPFVGGYLKRSGQFPVDQANARAAVRSLARATESLKKGMPLVIFPEGGRAADGHISPFMSGAFHASIRAQVPIVPLAIVHTFEALPMNSFHIQPRELLLIVGEPISPDGHSMKQLDDLAAKTQQVIENMYYAHAPVPDPRINKAS
jgi:1-acyl-sn-glycerol-3-phosphate acyltransferase